MWFGVYVFTREVTEEVVKEWSRPPGLENSTDNEENLHVVFGRDSTQKYYLVFCLKWVSWELRVEFSLSYTVISIGLPVR